MTISFAGTSPDKILRFPENVVSEVNDENGQPSQYVLIQISSSARGTLINGDAAVPKGPPTTENGAPTFQDQLPNRIYNITNPLSEINSVIALPMPANFAVNTGIRYDADFEPAGALKAMNFLAGNSSASSKMAGVGIGALTNMMFGGESKSSKGGMINQVMNKAIGSGVSPEQALASQRLAVNPRKEVTFQGMDFRSFPLSYTFSPKSVAETAQLKVITDTLRFYALPELAGGGMYFIFPGVFLVSFKLGEGDNPWVPKMGASVLKNINIDYSPNGTTWSSFHTGAPTFVRISMEFLEVELVDRIKSSQGY